MWAFSVWDLGFKLLGFWGLQVPGPKYGHDRLSGRFGDP